MLVYQRVPDNKLLSVHSVYRFDPPAIKHSLSMIFSGINFHLVRGFASGPPRLMTGEGIINHLSVINIDNLCPLITYIPYIAYVSC